MNPGGRKKMPWYTKALISLLADGKSFVGEDKEGYMRRSYAYTPESVDILYNMFSDELGFNPSMVKRSNILTKALPKELMSYAKSGDVSQSLKNIREPLLNIYFNNDSQSRSDLLSAILKYDEENNLYTDKGRKFIQKATESGLLNQESIRDLYFKKYEDKYPYRN